MSTPRTDNSCGWPWGHHGRIETGDLRWSPDGPFVHSSVARELERENVALRKQLEQWEQSTQWFAEWADKKQELECENAALRDALNEFKNIAFIGMVAPVPDVRPYYSLVKKHEALLKNKLDREVKT